MVGRSWNKGGNEWQKYISLLLKRKYGAGGFLEIPDTDRGDFGIEGFSRDGNAYQCYAAEEPLSSADLLKKQKIKITRDIKKFKDNQGDLLRVFGPTKIKCWILVVPRWSSKDLTLHGEKKAKEIRDLQLEYVDENFVIHIITEDYFQKERKELYDVGMTRIEVDPIEVEQCEIDDWMEEEDNEEMLVNLERKIRKIRPRIPDKIGSVI